MYRTMLGGIQIRKSKMEYTFKIIHIFSIFRYCLPHFLYTLPSIIVKYIFEI